MNISITRTDALIGIERSPSRLEMESEPARLELRQKHAKINITSEKPAVLIDQYEAFASSGLKNAADLSRDLAQRAYQQVFETIGKLARDGDMLAAIENGGNPIADIAERDAFPEKEFGMVTMPATGPRFEVTGSLKIETERNWEEPNNGVEGNYIPGSLKTNYTPSVIQVYMRRYPSVDIKYTGRNIDKYI